MLIKEVLKQIRDYYYRKRRKRYFKQLQFQIPVGTSIISSNCFAGRIMQDLELEYNSPTLGLYFWSPDYIEFLSKLDYYLNHAKLYFVNESKYQLGRLRHSKWKHWYPIGLLDGKVEIHFLHYKTETEAADKWYRRASRVNLDKLLIIGMEQNECSVDDILRFDKLPYKNKYFFSTRKLPDVGSNVYMHEFRNRKEVGDPYKYAHIFYKHLLKELKNLDE